MMSLFLQRRVRLLSRELKRKFLVWLVLGICLAAAGFIIVIAGTSTPEPDIACAIVKSSARQRDSSTENLPAAKSRAVTFLAVGDIMLSRTVAAKIKAHQDVNYPFLKTCALLSSADFAFGNLETSITEGPIVKSGLMMFRADPGVESALKNCGFEILSLANNHTPNFGQKGLFDTFEYLEQAGIKYVGAGENFEEAHQPVVIEKKGTRLAFLAYNDTDVVPDGYEAGTNRAGTAFMDIAQMKKDLDKAKKLADAVIVSMHSGTEYAAGPNARQTAFARAAIEAGAELIIGHHPHVVQSVEEYEGKLIVYSLGNFVFDQMWSEETRQGTMALISLSSNAVTDIEFIPVLIEDYAQPRPADESETAAILARLQLQANGSSQQSWKAAP